MPLNSYPIALKQNGNFYSLTFADSSGNYKFYVPGGNNYTDLFDTAFSTADLTVICPPSASYAISNVPITGLDFAIECIGSFDLFTNAHSYGIVPGFPSTIHVSVGNNVCTPVNGIVKLVLPGGVTYLNGISGATIIGDTVLWNLSNIISTSSWAYKNYYLNLHIDASLIIGDSLCFELFVTPIGGDANTSNNIFSFCKVINGSFDPNEKIVEPAGVTSAGLVLPNTTFTYIINFQNTGTAVAHFITIVDTLDVDLDPATLQILNSSHLMSFFYLPDNIIHFNFYNIMLPDSNINEPLSHGSLQYTIAARNNLLQGTEIKNTAHIYFDFNPAVVTNTTLNTIDYTLTVTENKLSNSFVIYPQPTADIFYIKSDKMLNGLLKIYDTKGILCKQQKVNEKQTTISTKDLSGGVYYVTIQTDKSTLNSKLVIVK